MKRPCKRLLRSAITSTDRPIGSNPPARPRAHAWPPSGRPGMGTQGITIQTPPTLETASSQPENSVSRQPFTRTELEAELAAVKGDRDALADDNEAQAGELEQQSAQLDALEATTQQQTGRIAQMQTDLANAVEAVARERGMAEQARQSLAKAELRLEALPRIETELERMRAALENATARAVASEQLAAVTAANLAGVETRLAESGEREKTLVSRLASADAAAREQSAALLAMSEARHRAEAEVRSFQAEDKRPAVPS